VLDLTPYAIAVGGVTCLLAVWLLVQRLWARVFAVDDCDVLAVRNRCSRCTEATCAVRSDH
jgi:hypothetical protein